MSKRLVVNVFGGSNTNKSSFKISECKLSLQKHAEK